MTEIVYYDYENIMSISFDNFLIDDEIKKYIEEKKIIFEKDISFESFTITEKILLLLNHGYIFNIKNFNSIEIIQQILISYSIFGDYKFIYENKRFINQQYLLKIFIYLMITNYQLIEQLTEKDKIKKIKEYEKYIDDIFDFIFDDKEDILIFLFICRLYSLIT